MPICTVVHCGHCTAVHYSASTTLSTAEVHLLSAHCTALFTHCSVTIAVRPLQCFSFPCFPLWALHCIVGILTFSIAEVHSLVATSCIAAIIKLAGCSPWVMPPFFWCSNAIVPTASSLVLKLNECTSQAAKAEADCTNPQPITMQM